MATRKKPDPAPVAAPSLKSSRIGTIFLDRHLRIRRFTREATSVYRLVATDIRSEVQRVDLLARCAHRA